MRPQRILLIGMMGSGKSTVGRLLAERLGWPYLDNDAMLERRAGCTLDEVFARGVDAGHALEFAVFEDQLARPGPAVLSVAGSIALDPRGRERLRREYVVWLRASAATLADRVTRQDKKRPLVDGGPGPALVDAIVRLASVREPQYASVATLVVDVDGLAPEQAASRILAAI